MITQGRTINVSSSISNTTGVIVFNGEEIIITEVDCRTYGHTIIKQKTEDGVDVYSLHYLEDIEYFKDIRTRKVLIEKYKKIGGYLYWMYNFYEPVKVLGKASEFERFKKLFPELTEIDKIFTPETTLILKRSYE